MDHNQLEKERGITILSKATAVDYRDGYVVNIVDTPGSFAPATPSAPRAPRIAHTYVWIARRTR